MCNNESITIRISFLLVKILYTRHVLENNDPNVIVKPRQKQKLRSWNKETHMIA